MSATETVFNKKISLCIPMYNESSIIADTAKTLHEYMSSTFENYEIIFSNDGSKDGCDKIVEEMNLKPGIMGLIINRAPGGVLDDGVKAEIEKHGLKLLGVLPQDDSVYRCDCDGEPSAKLPASNPVKTAVKEIMVSLGL